MKILQFLLIIGTLTCHGAFLPEHSERVVKGRNCNPEESKYLISIVSEQQKNLCGASLLRPRWIITAAHCCEVMKRRGIKWYTVLAGQTSWLYKIDQYSAVEEVFMPPDYTFTPVTNDVCLIKLKTPITPSSKVAFSQLATNEQFKELISKGACSSSLAMGNGRQYFRAFNERPNDSHAVNPNPYNQCINMDVLDRKSCQEHPVLGVTITDTVICTIDPIGGVCQGDSGGPLFCQGLQIGLVSATIGCADLRYPSVFARVDEIKENFEAIMNYAERSLIDRNENASGTNTSVTAPAATTGKPIKSSSGAHFVGYYKILLCILLYLILY